MAAFLAAACFLAAAASAAAVPPPAFPPRWPREFSVNVAEVTINVTTGANGTVLSRASGRWSYSASQRALRQDRENGAYDELCGSPLTPGAGKDPLPCTQLAAAGARWVIWPSLSPPACCMCCTFAQGCGPETPAWLDDAAYLGRERLEMPSSSSSSSSSWRSVEADKWNMQAIGANFWWQDTASGLPLALWQETNGETDYFTRSTLSLAPIEPRVFEVPSFCGTTADGNHTRCRGWCEANVPPTPAPARARARRRP